MLNNLYHIVLSNKVLAVFLVGTTVAIVDIILVMLIWIFALTIKYLFNTTHLRMIEKNHFDYRTCAYIALHEAGLTLKDIGSIDWTSESLRKSLIYEKLKSGCKS